MAVAEIPTSRVRSSPESIEAWLTAQLEAIADELWDRVYRPQQRVWSQAACPWCRRLTEISLTTASCPICSKIRQVRGMEGDL